MCAAEFRRFRAFLRKPEGDFGDRREWRKTEGEEEGSGGSSTRKKKGDDRARTVKRSEEEEKDLERSSTAKEEIVQRICTDRNTGKRTCAIRVAAEGNSVGGWIEVSMVSMALAVNFGLDSAQHSKIVHPAVCGVAGSAGDGGGPPSLSPAGSWPQAAGSSRRRCSLNRRQKRAPGSGYGNSSAFSSCACRRVRCSAELKTCSSVEVDEDNSGQDAIFRPTLGWPFFGVLPSDLNLSGKKVPRVKLSEPPVPKEGEQQSVAVSDLFQQGETTGESLYRYWIATEFQAAVQSGSPPPRQKEEKQSERDNYYVNTGHAIRTLRDELPNLFYRRLNFDIYRDDITFRDPMNTFSGIDNYKLIFWALRFHGRIFFRALWVDINRVWQPHDKVIMIRWTVRGIPRVPWEAQGHFEGTSEYKLDKEGKIYEHKVDNVIFNSPTRYHVPSALDLVRVAAANTNPTPSFCGRATLLLLFLSPYLKQFTWVRFYWALKSTLVLNNPGNRCDELGLNA